MAVVAKCHLSALYKHEKGKLFAQLVDLLQFYEKFEINDHVGTQLTDDEVLQSHYDRFQSFQLLAFKKIPKLRELALANIGAINKRADLSKKLSGLSPMDLRDLVCHKLKLISEEDPWSERVDFLIEVMVSFFEKQQSQKESINALPLYTNEQIISSKLNIQFLMLHDYLLQNFNLFRLESIYEIREEIQEVVPHLLAYINKEGELLFTITKVKQPNIGEVKPSFVTADVTFSISSYKAQIRSEWNALKEHDVLFLLSICPSFEPLSAEEAAKARTLMNDFTGRIKRDEWKPPKGELRTVTVAVDTAQYHMDVSNIAEKGAGNVYGTFNILMRRKPKENNFKAILESIRDLMNEYCIVPDWLHNVFLGYRNPFEAQWTNMPDLLEMVDFKDTFLDANHLKDSFSDYQVCFINPDGSKNLQPMPPFRIRLPKTQKGGSHALGCTDAAPEDTLIVEAYTPPDLGPYPQDQPKQNSVRFTPTHIGAIISGIQTGLTMVALNDLFEKIMQRDVPTRYLLHLGQGEQELATDLDFSRQGRVNAMLVRRLELLGEVERLARSLQLPEDVGYTCETAGYFWLLHVYSRREQFLAACAENEDKPTFVKDRFPFKEFFCDTPHSIFMGESFEKDMRAAKGCFRHLKTMFQELEECRAFELLKSTADRANYLMTKQAKIVAMTCTHAALKRKEFLQLGYARLKRCILIGDHHQHMDQSLFTRFVSLGIPYIELNAQGRTRPSIAKLYNWRYRDLGDLPYVKEDALVDVPDYQGRGERAEYVVSVYMYLRLLGYPANKISILTTYNGQKLLIRDVINRRCVPYDFIGPPSKVTTVDKFQGQQNDFILLSLMRTRFVGHLRDVRRLVVAMSRAQLGLYITSYTERHVEDTGPIHLVSGVEEMISIFNWRYQVCMAFFFGHSNGEVDKIASKNDENGRLPESNSSEENMME
ncbi:hypothetical protein ACJW31_11G157600 [Castanea mollissima]